MAATSTAIDTAFDIASYGLNIPSLDGHRATKLDIRFSGGGTLDRTSLDDLALLEAAILGAPVRLIVVGEVGAKGFRLNRKADDEEELLLLLHHEGALRRGW